MKKILLSVIMLVMLVMPVFAEFPLLVLLDGKVATGAGTAVDLQGVSNVPVEKFTCMLTAAGTAATSFTMILEGSINGINFYGLVTNTYTVATADTAMFHVVNKGVKYIRGNFSSKSGGDGTSAITMECMLIPVGGN